MDNLNLPSQNQQGVPPISLTINYVTVSPSQDSVRGSHNCPHCRSDYDFTFRPQSRRRRNSNYYGDGSESNPVREEE